MKICGTVSVEVPECEGFECNKNCQCFYGRKKCAHMMAIYLMEGQEFNFFPRWNIAQRIIPGSSCPAHSTVPNPWADYVCTDYGVTTPGDRPEGEWDAHKAKLPTAWEEKPNGYCPECGRDAWVNKWNIWYCDACGKANP